MIKTFLLVVILAGAVLASSSNDNDLKASLEPWLVEKGVELNKIHIEEDGVVHATENLEVSLYRSNIRDKLTKLQAVPRCYCQNSIGADFEGK